ncbi:MAG: hypothetical protein ACYC0J_03195, partial [Gammaproteobacteria bacterium]
MKTLSETVELSDVYNDLFLLIYLLHEQCHGNFEHLKSGQLEKGDSLDLARICIAQIMELMKKLDTLVLQSYYSAQTDSKEKTYQTLRHFLLEEYIQEKYVSATDSAKLFAEQMLKACIEQYSDDKLRAEFAGVGKNLVSPNGINLFHKKTDWSMDFKIDLNWSVPAPVKISKEVKKISKRKHSKNAGLLVDEADVYEEPNKPDYDNYYRACDEERTCQQRKRAQVMREFLHNLLLTIHADVMNEIKAYQQMQRTHWLGRLFGMDPANMDIVISMRLEFADIQEDSSSSLG